MLAVKKKMNRTQSPLQGAHSLMGVFEILHKAWVSLHNACLCAKSLQLCLPLCDPVDCIQTGKWEKQSM